MAKRIYANERKNNIFEKKVMPENNIYYATLKTRHGYRWLRRFQDILFSLIAIIILSPVMLITVISIIIDDPKGCPVFSQIRVGKNGKEFKMYKFRSMVVDAEDRLKELLEENEMDGPVFKIADDPRITRVGKFIRKTSIDELPQLFNILKGDMSIVGPRPALPREVEQYSAYQAHLPCLVRTTIIVLNMIFQSTRKLRSRIYCISISTHSSKEMSFLFG